MTIREHRAKQLAAVTGLLVVALTILSALVQGSVARRNAAVLDRGRILYEQSGCARCHSISGQGSLRAPLDGVGRRLSPEQIEAWIRADAEVAGALPRSVVAAKAEYREIPKADREALAKWLAETTRL